MIRAILIDIDNTLLSFDQSVHLALKNGFDSFGLGAFGEWMLPVFHKVNISLWQSLEKGEISFEELQKIRFNRIFDSLGVSADGEAFEAYFRDFLFESAVPEDGALELLSRLHKSYILAAASNGPYLQQEHRLKIAGMLPFFTHLFISEEIGFSKPDPAFFETCLRRLNAKASSPLTPDEILIIGDSLSSDMELGIRCGLKTCLYNPKNKSVPAGIKLDSIVSSLSEIPSLL